MQLHRFRRYSHSKKGISFWKEELYITEQVTEVIFQEIGNVVIATMERCNREILNVSYPQPQTQDGKWHAWGYLEINTTRKNQPYTAPFEHWVWG